MEDNKIKILQAFIKAHNIKNSHIANILAIPRQNIAAKLDYSNNRDNFTSSQEIALKNYFQQLQLDLTTLLIALD